ncbi:DUF6153 family protein [Terrabacter sp. GCM10028922]|uniref:DUF6153 family protein n=1 Tax=Terrabacter sp. GCM10028922 TaxID=3273428 RepID=UPI00361B5998
MRPQRLRAVVGLMGLGMLIAAVVAMHSMGAGHSRVAGVHGVSAAHEPGAVHTSPLADDASGRCGACLSQLVAAADSHAMAAMCLAVLTGLALLLLGRLLLRGRERSPFAHDRRRDLILAGRAPPGLSAPSLSQLGVLRV